MFLQYVVIPTRRSTAEAFQFLLSHALGDAGSPYIIGVVSIINVRPYTAAAFRVFSFLILPVFQISDWLKHVLKPSTIVDVVSNVTQTLNNGTIEKQSPFGVISPPGCNGSDDTSGDINVEFNSLQYSLFITSFVEVFGGLFFLICAWYIVEDKLRADKAIIGECDI